MYTQNGQNPFEAMMHMMQQMSQQYYGGQPGFQQQNPGFPPQQPMHGMQGFNPTPKPALPIGVTGIDHNGVFIAESVNDLATWDDYVIAKDGGTYKGIRVYFCNMEEKKRKPNADQPDTFKRRETQMARFEICRPSGRNPINSVINIFMRDKYSHIPYLDPKNWDSCRQQVMFRNLEDGRLIPYNLEIVTFNGEIITDDLHKRCKAIVANAREMMVYKLDGKEYDEDGEYEPDTDTANQ